MDASSLIRDLFSGLTDLTKRDRSLVCCLIHLGQSMKSIFHISLAAVMLTLCGVQQAAASDLFATQRAHPGITIRERYFEVTYSAPCASGKGSCEIEETWFVEWSYIVMVHSYDRENGRAPQRDVTGQPMDDNGQWIENFQPIRTCELRSEFILNEMIGLIPEGSAEGNPVNIQADNVHAFVLPGDPSRTARACGFSGDERAAYVRARERQARDEFTTIITTINRVQFVTDYILTQRPGAQIVVKMDP
jgi:hypothetical protein